MDLGFDPCLFICSYQGGRTMKTLSMNRQQDGSGFYLNLSVKEGEKNSKVGVAVSAQEFSILRIIMQVRMHVNFKDDTNCEKAIK